MNHRPLRFERLEDRRVLAAGVTVITHGAQFASSTAPDWAITMGQAILDVADGASTGRTTGSMFLHDPTTGLWNPLGGGVWTNSNNPAEHIVLVYNWSSESFTFASGWIDAAADNLFASLLAMNANLPDALATTSFIDAALAAGGGGGLLDLHFIGHSRGAVLNALVAERFGNSLDDLTIDQVTSLDGHPASLMDDPGYVSDSPSANSRVFTYDNVRFSDSYYQQDGAYEPILPPDFDGVVANGAYNLRLSTATLENGGSGLEHSDVHTWYYGTITAGLPAAYSGFSGATRNNDGDVAFPDAWFGAADVPAREATGFAYSQIVGASREGLPTTGLKLAPGPVETVFNGDLSKAGSLAGWQRHGGGGSDVIGGGADPYFELRTGDDSFRRHNPLYFGRHATSVEYDYAIVDNDAVGADDVLQLLVGGAVIDTLSLAALTGFITDRRATLSAGQRAFGGFTTPLEFRIVDGNGDGIESAVRIDNVSLVIEPPAPTSDFDDDGDADGADFLAWQRGQGKYLHAALAEGDADLDGNVLADDLAVWRLQFGAGLAAAAAGSEAIAASALAASDRLDAAFALLAAADQPAGEPADPVTAVIAGWGAVVPLSSTSPLRNSTWSSFRRSSAVDNALATGTINSGSPSTSFHSMGTSSFLAMSEMYSTTLEVGSGSNPARTRRNLTVATSSDDIDASASIEISVSTFSPWYL